MKFHTQARLSAASLSRPQRVCPFVDCAVAPLYAKHADSCQLGTCSSQGSNLRDVLSKLGKCDASRSLLQHALAAAAQVAHHSLCLCLFSCADACSTSYPKPAAARSEDTKSAAPSLQPFLTYMLSENPLRHRKVEPWTLHAAVPSKMGSYRDEWALASSVLSQVCMHMRLQGSWQPSSR